MVGTLRKNKPELPPALLASKGREVFSSKFAFMPTATLVSYLPKKNKNILLLSTLHAEAEVSRRQDRKPAVILDYRHPPSSAVAAAAAEAEAVVEAAEARDERETFPSKSGKVNWSSVAYRRQGRTAECKAINRTSGPTTYAVSRARNVASMFSLFITPAIEKIVLQMTNAEGFRKYGEGWKRMDETDLRAYVGLLIIAGVYRSRGEDAASLWDAESGRAIFRATMPLKLFHTYSRLLRFDDRESRATRHATDKLAAVREVWDRWVGAAA